MSSPEMWSKEYRIDSLDAALHFVEALWAEDHVPPNRLHSRNVGDGDAFGAPAWSPAFARYLFANPHDTEVVVNGYADGGVIHREGRDQVHYRYPLWRALTLLARREHDRWTRDVPRRPFHPSPVGVLLAMAGAKFRPPLVLRYANGDRVPDDMAELFAIGAARKLRATYQTETVGYVQKSEAQQSAEGAA